MKLISIFCSVFILNFCFFGQKNANYTNDYIDTYKEIAIKEMKRTGIPASITLAQGILESGWGKSRLAKIGNNHFGIKCHKGWKGGSMKHDDDAKDECFRTYKNAQESYKDHSEFLTGRSRYAFIFKYDSQDYKNWAKGLKKAGYATNPKYADLLIDKIERYHLNIYDKKDWKKRENALSYNKLLNNGDVVYNYKTPESYYDNEQEEIIVASATINDYNFNSSSYNYNNSSYNYNKPSYNYNKPSYQNNYAKNTTQPSGKKVIQQKPRVKPVVEFRRAKPKKDKIVTNVEINAAFKNGDVIKEKGTYNKLKYVTLKYPASPFRAAKALRADMKKLLKWNEVSENYTFPAEGKIYLQKKRTKPVKGVKTHTVKMGETMNSISNLYGVKVLALYLRNKIKAPKNPNAIPEFLPEGKVLKIK